jgi:glycosyltransferase involved in cell wall biosynthesis
VACPRPGSEMKLLFCCAQYWPSVGGVQEVIRQIAEHLAEAGHEVAVATSQRSDRKTDQHNGVRIHQFRVNGNLAVGLSGEVDRYRRFVGNFDGDAILIKAAQQWSFDALWPVLDDIKARKVFVPCGFSGLYEPIYARYFAELPAILRKFDHLIFYAQKYRDIEFAKANGIENYSIIPNGASEKEFGRAAEGRLRTNLGIAKDDFLFLTVGSPVTAKGHKEVGAAFARMDTGGRNATLILNGSFPAVDRRSLMSLLHLRTIRKAFQILGREGWRSVWARLFPKQHPIVDIPDVPAASVEPSRGTKRTLCLDLPRPDVIDAFLEADLFVFASKVEYSPLVLFEAAASGTPFVTVPVGNATEIVRWTGGGWLCPADFDEKGYVNVSPVVLAAEMERAIRSPELLRQFGEAGRLAWQKWFTWATIAKSYEGVLGGQSISAPLLPAVAEMASAR